MLSAIGAAAPNALKRGYKLDSRSLSLTFPAQALLEFTGERYVPGVPGQIQQEHYHRYLAAAPHVIGKKVLDIASGEGYGSWSLSQIALQMCGVDVDKDVVKYANRTYKAANLEFKAGSISSIPYPDGQFDVAICFETIEHVTEQVQAIAELKRVLRPGGVLLISSPNADADDQAWHLGNPFHEKELNLAEFRSLLEAQFANIRFAEQRVVHGSVLADMDEISRTDERLRFQSSDGSSFSATRGDLGQAYFLAIASDGPVPGLGLSILDGEAEWLTLQGHLKDAVHFAHQIDAALKEKDQLLQEQASLLKAAELHLTEVKDQLAQSQRALKKLSSWRALAEIQLANLRERIFSDD